MGPFWISLLMLSSFTAFGVLAARKLRIVMHLQPEVRWDHPAGRLLGVLANGFLQSRMIRRDWKPGLMHAVIFLGFMALLARKLQLIIIGYHEPFAFQGLAGGLFAAGKDAVELAVLAALAYAFWRRYVQKPARLEANREALLILSLITAIMITDFLFDGFRFALFAGSDAGIAHERAFAFAGRRVAEALSALSPEMQRAGYVLSYWLQLLVVFAFLVILPVGEHFHIVTALPTLFFRRGRPANRVPSVDLEKMLGDDADAADLRVGARTAADLTWKEGLDVFTCTECGRCKDACPTFLTGKPLTQMWVHTSLKHHLLAQREQIVAREPADDALPPLAGGVISEDTLWACTTCGYCETACPIELEHLPRFFRMRQHRVMMDGQFPHELKAVFAAYESQSNPWGFSSDTRADWARDVGVPIVTSPEQVKELDFLYYVGSAESFDPRGQKVARAIAAILHEAGVKFGILGVAETSTGECVRRAGNEMLFQQLAATLVGTLNGLGVTRIVTGDPHAFNSLRNEYPEFEAVLKSSTTRSSLPSSLPRAGSSSMPRSSA
jgi:ferredoxin